MSVFRHGFVPYRRLPPHARDLARGKASKTLLYSSSMNDTASAATTVEPAGYVHGSLSVPGDKSISHRYALLAALADGRTTIGGYAPGADCETTLRCLRALGVGISHEPEGQVVTIEGTGLGGLRSPDGPLDCGNSGTTMRLLAGILAANDFETTLVGDSSLERRPMRRIVDPLLQMGARIEATDGRPPLAIVGGPLHGVEFEPAVASAQVKSAVLLAGLHAEGETWVVEPEETRDHTERALPIFGVSVLRRLGAVGVPGGQRLQATSLSVPGDFSSATYWLVAAAALPRSTIEVVGVGLNPTRTRLLDVLRIAGASVDVTETETRSGEPIGTITVAHRKLNPVTITAQDVPALIDELPALAALGVHGGGLRVSGASELRAKESDRISVLVAGLKRLGARVDEYPDGFHVHGDTAPTGGTVDACGDHRMAMAFAVAALGATGPTDIIGHEIVDVSYPGFFEALDTLRG